MLFTVVPGFTQLLHHLFITGKQWLGECFLPRNVTLHTHTPNTSIASTSQSWELFFRGSCGIKRKGRFQNKNATREKNQESKEEKSREQTIFYMGYQGKRKGKKLRLLFLLFLFLINNLKPNGV